MKLSPRGAGIFVLCGAAIFAACSDQTATSNGGQHPPDVTPPGVEAGNDPTDGGGAGTDATNGDAATGTPGVRIMAANTTSGASTSYTPQESIRLFQGLKPDIILIQEFRYGGGTDGEIRQFVDTAFDASYKYYREPAATLNDIPNGIISRYPIVESGSWDDPNADNRGFAYAKIEIPNAAHPLWAVSLHLLTSSPANRNTEAIALVAKIKDVVPDGDYLVVGGDLNTSVRTEQCMTTLSDVLVVTAPYPDDGAGNDNTNGPRTKAFDWLLADPDLSALSQPITIGGRSFSSGLVFDSRIYEPLSDVAPVQKTDSDALNMQHMPVVREFALPK